MSVAISPGVVPPATSSSWRAPPASTPISVCAPPAASSRSRSAPTAFSAAPTFHCRSNANSRTLMPSDQSRGITFGSRGFRTSELCGGFLDGFCDQQGLLLVERKILNALLRGQRQHHDVGLLLGPPGGERGHKIRGCFSIGHGCETSWFQDLGGRDEGSDFDFDFGSDIDETADIEQRRRREIA